jgi:hypothetical protein
MPKTVMKTTYRTMDNTDMLGNKPGPSLALERYDHIRISPIRGSTNCYCIYDVVNAQNNKTLGFVYFPTAQNVGVEASFSLYFKQYT